MKLYGFVRACPQGLFIAMLAGAPGALAADLEARGRIEAATLFPDGAEVRRVIAIEAPAGASALIVKGLPWSVDPASLRVAGEGGARLLVSSVEARVAPAEAKSADGAGDARLKSLRSDREGWQVNVEALAGKKAMIERYAQASPDRLGPEGKALDPGQWEGAFDRIGAALVKVGEDLRGARGRLREIDEEIASLEAARAGQRPRAGREPQRDIVIAFEAQNAGAARLTLTYRVAGAAWRPAYDAQATTEGGLKLGLTRRALITQRTGEDWSDIALTLSTLRVAQGAGAPDVPSERLAFFEPGIVIEPASPSQAAPKAAGAPRLEADMARARRPAAPVSERMANVETSAYSAQFVAPGKFSAPSDGALRSIALSSQEFKPAVILKTAPAFDPAVYLEAQMINADEAPLLAGEVNVQRDGTFVGKTRIGAVAPGEEFSLGLGVDERVRANRVPVRRRESDPPGASTRSDIQEFRTSLKNLHDFPVRVLLVDRMPYSENAAISVDMLAQTTPPATKAVQDKRGVVGWKIDLAPGEQKDVRFGWRVRSPADRPLVRDIDPAQTFRFSGGATF